MHTNRAWLSAFGLAIALGGSAAAQTQPTPEQASALEKQITDWLITTTGGAFTLPARPVQLTPEGDHFIVRIPLAPLAGTIDPPDAAFTGKARLLDGTRWALDDQQFPPEFSVTASETVPDPSDAKNPSPDGTHKEDVKYRIKLGDQAVHSVFDTDLATPTTSNGTIASLDIEKEGGSGASLTHVGQFITEMSTSPVDAQHVDILSDAAGADYSTRTELPDGTQFTLQANRLHVVSTASSLAHGQLVPLFHLVSQLASMIKAPGGDNPDGPTPEQKAKLHDMLQQAHDILTGVKLDETIEGAKFEIAGNSGALGKGEISLGGDAPADKLSASMGMTLDGLVLDDLPPALVSYVPSHFTIHPTLSNVSVSALTSMGLAATAPVPDGQTPPAPDIAALFANGGIKFGFDSLALDMAGAHLAGTGEFTAANPAAITGQANLTVRGLDALIAKGQSDPMMQQAVPVMIFLKGIARTTGDQSIWQITVNNTNILVNGVDLSAMMGGPSK